MLKPFDIEIASLTDALDPRCAPALSPRSASGNDPGARSFYIETFGCQMNVHDSEKVAGVLLDARLPPGGCRGGRRSGALQHVQHPREGRAKGFLAAGRVQIRGEREPAK